MTIGVVTRGGRVTIPAAIRRELNIQPGDRVTVTLDGDEIRVTPESDVVSRTAGMLSAYAKVPTPTTKELKDAMEQAIAEDVVDRMNR